MKGLIRSLSVGLVGVLVLYGASSLTVDCYVTWYNWKYQSVNIKAVPLPFFSFKYVAKPGYHLEALCDKGSDQQVRYTRLQGFDHFDVITDKRRVDRDNCEILIVENLDIPAPPLKDYDIKPVQPK